MLRPRLVCGLTLLLLGVLAAPAAAATVEVGRADAAPSCPASPCLAVSRTTGYQAKVAASRTDFVVPADGKIVAWTIALASPSADQIAFFNRTLGGTARARLTVLRPGKRLYSRVVTQTRLQRLQPFFGQTVQFPLGTAINVKKGYVIALSVPTWAPALTPLLEDGSSWRASRPVDGCSRTDRQTAQSRLKQLGRYRCLYKARLTYSATLITHATPTADLPPAG